MDESKKIIPENVTLIENQDTKITVNFVCPDDDGGIVLSLHCKGVIPYGYWVRSAAIDGVMCEPYDNFLKPVEEGDLEFTLMMVYGTGASLPDGNGGYTKPVLDEINEIKLDIVVLEDDGSYGDVEEPDDVMANTHGIASKTICEFYPNGGTKTPEYTIGGVRAVVFDNEQFAVFIKDIMDSERIAFPDSEEYRHKVKSKKVFLAFINKTPEEMFISTHSCLINGEPAEVSHIASRVLSGLSAIDAVQYSRPEDEYNNEIKHMRFAVAVQQASPEGPKLLMNNAVDIKL